MQQAPIGPVLSYQVLTPSILIRVSFLTTCRSVFLVFGLSCVRVLLAAA